VATVATISRSADEATLWGRKCEGDPGARDLLVERYMRLAFKLARRYSRTSEPLEDLEQVACLGLVNAVDRFDPDRGTSFSTFAVPTILGELRRYFRDSTWAVRPPRAKQERSLAVSKARDELSQGGARSPKAAEIAGALGWSQEVVLDALEVGAARRADSLDAPVGEGDETVIGHDLHGSPDPGYARVDDAVTVEVLTAGLDERARQILRLRFRDDLLQREIGDRIGLSQMHVSRILRDSLLRMQA
jgi:RNA polymerase sigma-B factor